MSGPSLTLKSPERGAQTPRNNKTVRPAIDARGHPAGAAFGPAWTLQPNTTSRVPPGQGGLRAVESGGELIAPNPVTAAGASYFLRGSRSGGSFLMLSRR